MYFALFIYIMTRMQSDVKYFFFIDDSLGLWIYAMTSFLPQALPAEVEVAGEEEGHADEE